MEPRERPPAPPHRLAIGQGDAHGFLQSAPQAANCEAHERRPLSQRGGALREGGNLNPCTGALWDEPKDKGLGEGPPRTTPR